MIKVTDRMVMEAEGIAERVALNYMGLQPSDDLSKAMQAEYKQELEKAGVPEGLIVMYLNQSSGSIFIYQPEKMLNERVKYSESN